MKPLTCEMCGSTNIIKQDGLFICQNCNTKYSVEEAKKMMIEGTVEIRGTVQIDNKENVSNLLLMAKNAYEANNLKETEQYSNRVIENDPQNYEAWLYKGKSSGWQSTTGKQRIIEAMNAFKNALENCPEENKRQLLLEVENETASLGLAVIRLASSQFESYPKAEQLSRLFQTINDSMTLYGKEILSFFLKYSAEDVPDFQKRYTSFKRKVSAKLNNDALDAYNKVRANYDCQIDPISQIRFDNLLDDGRNCYHLLDLATSLEDRKEQSKRIYLNIITVLNKLTTAYLNKYSVNNYVYKIVLSEKYKEEYLKKIEECHKKISEIDPEYNSPLENKKEEKKGGCYIATAVYGSYDCPEVWTLRRFRDEVLGSTWYGRLFIKTYYATSPTLVKWLGQTDWFREFWHSHLDKMVSALKKQGFKDTPYKDKNW